jgi:hypothetical protein
MGMALDFEGKMERGISKIQFERSRVSFRRTSLSYVLFFTASGAKSNARKF